MWYNLESPSNSFIKNVSKLDWTATYRRDSTIATPYAKVGIPISFLELRTFSIGLIQPLYFSGEHLRMYKVSTTLIRSGSARTNARI